MYSSVLNYEISSIKKESAPLVQTQNKNSNGPIRANEALPVISISSNSENVKIDTNSIRKGKFIKYYKFLKLYKSQSW